MKQNPLDSDEKEKRFLTEWSESRRGGRGRHLIRCVFWWVIAFSVAPALVSWFRNDTTTMWIFLAFSGPCAIAAGVFFGVVSWKEEEKKYEQLVQKHGLSHESDVR